MIDCQSFNDSSQRLDEFYTEILQVHQKKQFSDLWTVILMIFTL